MQFIQLVKAPFPEKLKKKLSIYVTNFYQPQSILVSNKSSDIWLSNYGNIWRYHLDGEYDDVKTGKFDANYIPRIAYFANNLKIKSMCQTDDNNVYFVSSSHMFIGQNSGDTTAKVIWKAPNNWKHLNGVCTRDGKLRYVTAFQGSNESDGGIVYDIVESKIVCSGLNQPNSPRWFLGRLWILEGATGRIGYIDLINGTFIEVSWLPGYVRGLSMVRDKYLAVGCSRDRLKSAFKNLPLGKIIENKLTMPNCGIHFICLKTFDIVHSMNLMSPIHEIYDLSIVNGFIRPRLVEIGDESTLRHYNIEY
jgi:uncharacterized protein (TIGR03032 family)